MLGLELREQAGQPDRPRLDLQRARVELRDIEQRIEEPVHRRHGLRQVADHAFQVAAAGAPLERAREQPDRMQRLAQVVARRGDEARLGVGRLLRRVALRAERPGRRVDPRLQFARACVQPRGHFVEAFLQRAQFAALGHVERRCAPPAPEILHRAGQRSDRTGDAVADDRRQHDGGHDAGEAENEPDHQQALLLGMRGAARHRDRYFPDERGLRPRRELLGEVAGEPRLANRVGELDHFDHVGARFAPAVREHLTLRIGNRDARRFGFVRGRVGHALQRCAIAGEEGEFRARRELARDRQPMLRERDVDFRDARMGEVRHQRKEDQHARHERHEQDAGADSPMLHGDPGGAAARAANGATGAAARARAARAAASVASSSIGSPSERATL